MQCKNHTFEWRLCNIQIMNTLRTLRECATNTHEIPHETHRKMSTFTHKISNEHTARRRGRFIVPVSLHNQIRIFTLSNPYIHFIAHVCPHFKIRIFTSPHTYFRSSFCGCFRICGHDKYAPTTADGLPITQYLKTKPTFLFRKKVGSNFKWAIFS